MFKERTLILREPGLDALCDLIGPWFIATLSYRSPDSFFRDMFKSELHPWRISTHKSQAMRGVSSLYQDFPHA